jgi:hypothetical protein
VRGKRNDVGVGDGMIQYQSPPPVAYPVTRRRVLEGALSMLALSCLRGLGDADISNIQGRPSLAVSDGFVVVDGWVLPGKYFRA